MFSLSRSVPCISVLLAFLGSFGCGQAETFSTLESELQVVAAIDFGEVAVESNRSEVIEVTNVGEAELSISDARISGDSVFDVQTWENTEVAAGATVLWEVTFFPDAAQAYDGTLLIQSDSQGGKLVQISLSGVGVRVCVDVDGDGYGDGCDLGVDCNDGDPAINPETRWYADDDSDGYGDAADEQIGCATPAGYVNNAGDCDDSNSTYHAESIWYADADSDTWGNAADSQTACVPPIGYVDNGLDCDDTNPDLRPDVIWYRDYDVDSYGDPLVSVEACDPPPGYVANGDDCDDTNPRMQPGAIWYRDLDGDTFGTAFDTVTACAPPSGYVGNDADCDDSDPTIYPGVTWYEDADGDTFGNPGSTTVACTPPLGYVTNGDDCDDTNPDLRPDAVWYRDYDADTYGDPLVTVEACDQPLGYVANGDDCEDTNPRMQPGTIWYRDLDGDTFGTPFDTVTACAPPSGYVGNDADCDDSDAARHPGATWYEDADGDTFGNPGSTTVACSPPPGYVANGDDCDDTDATILPTDVWYRDADGDSFGDPMVSRLACSQPPGFVANDLDCDDSDSLQNPDAIWYRDFDEDSYGNPDMSWPAVCLQPAGYVANDLDCDDTDPTIGPLLTWHRDLDNDGYGNPRATMDACAPPAGYVPNGDDCDDTNPAINPGAPERDTAACTDGIDNDCDGEPDSFDSECYYEDCGEPSYYLTTNSCNSDYPGNTGPQICEEYPNSPHPEGQREQCMEVCRNSADCPVGQACYPSRRSLNLHFCAPAIGSTLSNIGGSCLVDADCRTAMCHSGICREVCVRDADCPAGNICRAEVRTHAYIGNEISTGVCQAANPALKANGVICGARAECQSGICGQSDAGGTYVCRRSCGSDPDCGIDRCAAAIYDLDPSIGYGHRACAPVPSTGIAPVGGSCYSATLGGWGDAGCHSMICDGTYCPAGTPADPANCPIEPYCSGLCDRDSDCPLLFPGAFNVRMRCLITSSTLIQPLVGGYCVPFFCEVAGECPAGSSCSPFNFTDAANPWTSPKEWAWLARGICM